MSSFHFTLSSIVAICSPGLHTVYLFCRCTFNWVYSTYTYTCIKYRDIINFTRLLKVQD